MSEVKRALTLARAWIDAKRPAVALEILGPFILQGDPDALQIAAAAALSNHDSALAAALAAQCVERSPNDASAWSILAFAEADLGDRDTARRASRTCVRTSGGAAWSHAQAARLDTTIGVVDHTSVTHALAAIEGDPRDPWGHQALGQVLRALSIDEGAEECFREALRCDPQFQPALYDVARVAVDRGRTREAAKGLVATLRLDPSNYAALHDLASVVGRLLAAAGLVYLIPGVAAMADPPDRPAWYIALLLVGVFATLTVLAAAAIRLRRVLGAGWVSTTRHLLAHNRLLAWLAGLFLIGCAGVLLRAAPLSDLDLIARFAATFGIIAALGLGGFLRPALTAHADDVAPEGVVLIRPLALPPLRAKNDEDVVAAAHAFGSDGDWLRAYAVVAPVLSRRRDWQPARAAAARALRERGDPVAAEGWESATVGDAEEESLRVVPNAIALLTRLQLVLSLGVLAIAVPSFAKFLDSSLVWPWAVTAGITLAMLVSAVAWCAAPARRLPSGGLRIAHTVAPRVTMLMVVLALTAIGFLLTLPYWWPAIFGLLLGLVSACMGLYAVWLLRTEIRYRPSTARDGDQEHG